MTDKLCFTSEVIGDRYSADPDSAGKSREFYAKYWENTLSPNCADYSTAGKAIYRGDTTISFNTIAGSVLRLVMTADMPQGSFARLQAIQSSELITDDLKRQFTEFQKLYHSLANFLPLPDDKWHRHTNMNTAKGASAAYHDFPDLFYQAVHDQVFGGPNAVVTEPVFTTNKSLAYFKRFNCQWRQFVEQNYLQDFFTDDTYNEFIRLAPTDTDIVLYRARKVVTPMDRENGMAYAQYFLTTAITILNNRASRLADSKK